MSKPRSCPHCNKFIPHESGYHFDENLNMICAACGKTAFPTDPASETVIQLARSKLAQPYTPDYPGNYRPQPHEES